MYKVYNYEKYLMNELKLLKLSNTQASRKQLPSLILSGKKNNAAEFFYEVLSVLVALP